jgi:hypothetical protein
VKSQQNAERESTSALASAEEAYSRERSDENKSAVEEAKQEHQKATARYDQIRTTLPALRKASDRARSAANQFILDTKIDATNSVAGRLLAELNAINQGRCASLHQTYGTNRCACGL